MLLALLVFCAGILDLFLKPTGSSLKLWFLEIRLLWELIGGKDVEAGGVELGADVCFMCLQVSLSRVCESFYVFHFHESKFELVFLEN